MERQAAGVAKNTQILEFWEDAWNNGHCVYFFTSHHCIHSFGSDPLGRAPKVKPTRRGHSTANALSRLLVDIYRDLAACQALQLLREWERNQGLTHQDSPGGMHLCLHFVNEEMGAWRGEATRLATRD